MDVEYSDGATGALHGIRIVEISHDPSGDAVGRNLAHLGADVIKVELPTGARSRAIGPFAGGVEDPDNSLYFWYFNTNKKSVVIDYTTPTGRAELDVLLHGADVFLTTMHPDDERAAGLLAVQVHERFERLVVVSVTPFGLDGPWANWHSCDLVALALGSPLNSCGYDDHSIPPIRPGGEQGFQSAASFAQMGVVLALLQREHTGRGDLVQVSMHDCLAVGAELANPYWFYPEVAVKRQTCRHAQPSPTQPALFECGDGRWVYFVFFVLQQKGWYLLLDWLSSIDLALDLINPEYEDPAYRQENVGHIQGIIESFFLLQTAEEAYRSGQARGLPIGPINSPDEVLSDEHLNARGFFQHVETNGRLGTYPRLPLHFSAFPTADITPAPRLGQHTVDVLAAP